VVHVEAHVDVGQHLGVDRGAEGFVRGAQISHDGQPWVPVVLRGRTFEIQTPCKLRYDFFLREAADRLDDLDVAAEEDGIVEAPPSTWLVSPEDLSGDAKIRFRVRTPESVRFVTGVFPSRDVPGSWEITLDDLVSSPYSAFGDLRVQSVEAKGGTVQVAIAPGTLLLGDDKLLEWTRRSTRSIEAYFGRFPMPAALVLLVPSRGRWIGGGRTLAGGGGTIFVRVGERATWEALRDDWVLVHEMTHLTFPSVSRAQAWAEEGLATYVEPWARVRAGILSPEEAWRGLAEGLPNGLPQPGDEGLDRTRTWGRTYWGGALFFTLADVGIRQKTNNAKGLDDALRGVLAAGGNDAVRWPLDRVFEIGDQATGTTVLRDLHAAMGTSPHPVDVPALLASLGVRLGPNGARLDDSAPLAATRRAITLGHP
jgi:hypothetical protein